MKATNRIHEGLLYQWLDEQAKDAVRYHANNEHFKGCTCSSAFEAGFKEGYREAIANLKLHNAVNLDSF